MEISLEEKEAIDDCKNFMNVGDYIGEKEYKELQIAINYIEKLQKELDKKDKVIDLIITDYLNLAKERMSKEEFKKWYFDLVGIKKVEEENE